MFSEDALSLRLLRAYIGTAFVYVLAVVALWAVGVEAIYGSPTPFYALYFPALSLKSLHWHLLAVLVFAGFFVGMMYALGRASWFDGEPSDRFVAWFVTAAVVFAFLFPGAIAMLRDGTHGIAQAYERHGYEYVSDIGVTRSIQALFHDYLKLHPYLSMHAKVHPPGPIVLLWLISYVTGQDALPLSIATMVFGAVSIVPLYLWAADLTSRRTALTCCVLYSLMPSIVLFTATSADILFMPFTLTTLFLFWRALHRRSILYALAAGIGFAAMSLLSFSLIAVGGYFAFVGLWRFMEPKWRRSVLQTAVAMLLAFLVLHVVVRWWSGFDIVACFKASKAQFETDQTNLDLVTPRYSAWFWKVANPACWFFFAGVPVSLLFIWRVLGLGPRVSRDATPAIAVLCALTFVVLTLLYLGRGEGERSAMYVLPFVVLPAAHLLDRLCADARSLAPLGVTAVCLAVQCWAIESVLYTFW